MELMLDSANIEEVAEGIATFPVSGISINPTIMEEEGEVDFFAHLRQLKKMLGMRMLHVQVVSTKCDDILREADLIRERVARDVYIKIPVTVQGLKAIKTLASEGANITATSIVTPIQGILAAIAGADYLTVYYNRMEAGGLDPEQTIREISETIDADNGTARILCSSFRNVGQIAKAYAAGAEGCAVSPKLLTAGLDMPMVHHVLAGFSASWKKIHGTRKMMDL